MKKTIVLLLAVNLLSTTSMGAESRLPSTRLIVPQQKLNLHPPSDFNSSPEPRTSPNLNLSKVYEIAYQSDSKIEAARADLEATYQHFEADMAKTWGPQLALTANLVYGHKSVTPTRPSYFIGNGWSDSVGFSLVQPVFNYPQIVQTNQSEFATSVSAMRNAIAQQDLILRVVKSYLDVLRYQDFIKIKDVEIVGTKEHLEIVKQQFEVGLASQIDVSEAESKVAVAEAQKRDFESNLIAAKGVFLQTWGIDAKELLPLKKEVTFQPPTPNDPEKWIDQATVFNLNVQLNNGLQEIAQYDIEKAKAALYYPSVNLTATCSNQGISNQGPFGTNYMTNNGCSTGLNVSMPLYDGGYTPAHSKEMVAIKERIRNDVRTAQIQAGQNARFSFAAIRKGLSNVKLYQKSVQTAADALQGKREQYVNGLRTSFEVLVTLQNLNTFRQQLVSEKYDLIYNKFLLKQAVGILSVVDLEELDALLAKQ